MGTGNIALNLLKIVPQGYTTSFILFPLEHMDYPDILLYAILVPSLTPSDGATVTYKLSCKMIFH